MDDDKEQRIRARAHQLWIEAGEPEGQALHHWQQAEQLVSDDRLATAEQTDYMMQIDGESVAASKREQVRDGDQAKPIPKSRARKI